MTKRPTDKASTKELDKIVYKKNCLRQVIVRADFPNDLEQFERGPKKKFVNAILKKFPISQPREVLGSRLQVSEPSDIGNYRKMQWVFTNRDKSKTLTIESRALIFELFSYSTFENLRDDFDYINQVLNESYEDITITRLGLRYINEISKESGSALKWGDYIDTSILSLFDYSNEEQKYLSRIIHNLEYTYEEFNFRFQFGIPNPDYPAPISRGIFVLDLDAFVRLPVEKGDVMSYLDKFHGKIQVFFENSITNKLRKRMDE